MSMQCLKMGFTLLFVNLPQFHRPIKTAAGQQLPIRSEGQRTDQYRMSKEGLQAASTLHLPQLDAWIISTTGKSPSIRTKGQRPNATDMCLKSSQRASTPLFPCPSPDLPHPHHPIIVSLHKQVPLWTEGQRTDHAAISLQRSQTPSAFHLPEL